MKALPTILLAAVLAGLVGVDLSGQRQPTPESKPTTAEPAAAKAAEKPTRSLAITGGDVYLGTGQIIRRATVLVADDKITAVGHDLEIPEGATVIDATGKVVSPGFVAVMASGLGAPSTLSDGDVVDSINPYEPRMKMGLAAGITSYLANLKQGTSKPDGRSAVLKLAFGDLDGMVVRENSVLSMKVPLTPPQWKALRDLVEKAKKRETDGNEKADKEASKGKGKTAAAAKDLEPLLRVMKGDAVLWVSCSEIYDNRMISQALEIAALLGVGVVLDNPVTAWTMAEEIAETGSMAVIDPRHRQRADPERPRSTGSNLASCAILSRAGVPVAVRPPGGRFGGPSLGTGGILGQDLHTLNLDAAFAVRGGMDDHKALRTITLDAAKLIGAESRIGSIEVGKDADLLILEGDPLNYRTFVSTAVVNGKVVYQKDKEPFYSHIRR